MQLVVSLSLLVNGMKDLLLLSNHELTILLETT